MSSQQTEKQIHLEGPPQRTMQWLEQGHMALVRLLAHGHSLLVLASGGMKLFQVCCIEQEEGVKNTSFDGFLAQIRRRKL